MQDPIALLQSLTLPAGATTGSRIELDGVLGEIRVYDAAGNLRDQINAGGSGSFRFFPVPEGGHTFTGGLVLGDKFVGVNVAGTLDLRSPSVDGRAVADILLIGEDTGGNPPVVNIQTNGGTLSLTATKLTVDGNRDITIGGISLPRGVIGVPFDATANDAARAAGVNTDMAVTFTADATRLYEVTLKVQLNFGTAAVVYALDLVEGGTVGVADGTVIDRFARWSAAETPAGSLTGHVSASVQYRPTAGSKTVRVGNDAGSGGTVTMVGAATIRRQLIVKDIGAR